MRPTRASLTALPLAAVTLSMTLGSVNAWAQQQPVDPYAAPPPATTTVRVQVDAPAQPIDPYQAVPPQQFGYQPAAPPAYPPPPPPYPPPAYQNGYYLYPSQTPPVYYRPRLYGAPCCPTGCTSGCAYSYQAVRRPVQKGPWVRRFSLGLHGSVLGVNQKIGNDQMVMGGAGLQLRIRSQGRFGLELSQTFMRGDYWNGNFVRQSFPFTFGLMLYLFKNEDTRHFNIYGIAGVGAMLDDVKLRNQYGDLVSQDFLEWIAFAGLGAELRFKWFAIAADARFLGLWRDNTSAPASYYKGVDGGPIPDKSYGIQGNAYINFWF